MDEKRPNAEQLLDWLLDALEARRASRQAQAAAAETKKRPQPGAAGERQEAPARTAVVTRVSQAPPAADPAPMPPEKTVAKIGPAHPPPRPPERLPSIQLDRLLSRLFLALVLLVIIINIPLNRYGTNLAKAAPDSAALVIRDGLLLKGNGPEVYVLENDLRRWITTLDAFEWYGYRWDDVHEVEDDFLNNFEEGQPIHLLMKCHSSPHVYALETGQKRWIKDIPTFENRHYRWEDIQFVSCTYLRQLPDGPPIPEDAGPPPQP